MVKKVNRVFIITAVFVTFLGGCRSTAEYQKLAKAGSEYTTDLDSLLTEAGNIKIDETSEHILSDQRISNSITFSQYTELSRPDIERLKILEELREHNKLLARYFSLLNEVATSNAPQDAQKEIGDVADNLNKLGEKLCSGNLVNKTILQPAASLIISSQIRGALRQELQKRKDAK